MDCPDNIQYIQKTLDDIIRERNEICQANVCLEKREKQMKSHIDNLYYQCKQKNAELLQEEEINRELLKEISRSKDCVERLEILLGEKIDNIKRLERAEENVEKLRRLVNEQKEALKEMQRENRNLKDSLNAIESAQQNLSTQLVLKVGKLRKEIKSLREADKILKLEIESLDNDLKDINIMVREIKKNFEHACDQLAYLECCVSKLKGIENKLELQMKDICFLRDKLTTKDNEKVSVDKGPAEMSKENNMDKRDSKQMSKCKLSMTVVKMDPPPQENEGDPSSHPMVEGNKTGTSGSTSRVMKQQSKSPRNNAGEHSNPMVGENSGCTGTPMKIKCKCYPSPQRNKVEESNLTERRVHFAPSQRYSNRNLSNSRNCPISKSLPRESTTNTVSVCDSPNSILKNSDRANGFGQSISISRNSNSSSWNKSKPRHRRRLKRRECAIQ